MTDIMTNIVVTSGVAVNLRELSRRMGKTDLDGMFQTRLSASGNLPATHYISSGYIRPAYLNALTNSTRLFNVAKKAWEDDGDVFPFSQAQVTNALGNCTVTDGTYLGQPEGAYELMARLGLQIINV